MLQTVKIKRRTESGITSTLLLIGMLTLTFNIQQAKASRTIYIRANGGVDPSTAPIQRDGDVYTFVANIYDEIVVERSDTVIDGEGHLLKGTLVWWTKGIYLSGIDNVTIKNLKIQEFYTGIYIENSSYNIIAGNDISHTSSCIEIRGDFSLDFTCSNNVVYRNTITNGEYSGIFLQESSNNTIFGNTVAVNQYGIDLGYATLGNTVVGNNIIDNEYGVFLFYAEDNRLYYNSFVDNTYQSYMIHWMGHVYISYANVWHNGYPSGGNYWNNYADVDLYRGTSQDILGNDGIWDHPYVMQYDMSDPDNTDNYPLVEPWRLPKTIPELKATIAELARAWKQHTS